jgi:hypothetical protein
MRRKYFMISKPGEEIRPSIYSISSHDFYLLIGRLMSKCPILLVELTVRNNKLIKYVPTRQKHVV